MAQECFQRLFTNVFNRNFQRYWVRQLWAFVSQMIQTDCVIRSVQLFFYILNRLFISVTCPQLIFTFRDYPQTNMVYNASFKKKKKKLGNHDAEGRAE